MAGFYDSGSIQKISKLLSKNLQYDVVTGISKEPEVTMTDGCALFFFFFFLSQNISTRLRTEFLVLNSSTTKAIRCIKRIP